MCLGVSKIISNGGRVIPALFACRAGVRTATPQILVPSLRWKVS